LRLVISVDELHRASTEDDGLWWSHAAAPSADPDQWSSPAQMVGSADGTPWYSGGIWKPSVQADPQVPGRTYVFFNGAARSETRPTFSVGRIHYDRRPTG
jgi:hypothetical protein